MDIGAKIESSSELIKKIGLLLSLIPILNFYVNGWTKPCIYFLHMLYDIER